jgi:hypothetical protein
MIFLPTISFADVLYTLPPLGPDMEVISELQAHCKEPLFLRAELEEWQQVHDTESEAATSTTPSQI